jgi:hypothetical protein
MFKNTHLLVLLSVLTICATLLLLVLLGHEKIADELLGAICFVAGVGVFPLLAWIFIRLMRDR